jgi:hypothetical protein
LLSPKSSVAKPFSGREGIVVTKLLYLQASPVQLHGKL